MKYKLLVALLFSSVNLFASSEDSLLNELKRTTNPLKRINLFLELSTISKPEQTVIYISEVISLARTIKNDSLSAVGYLKTGKALYMMGKLETSLTYCDSALNICSKKKFPFIEYSANKTIGNIYRRKKKYTESLKSFIKSEAIATELNVDSLKADIYTSLGIVYSSMQDIIRAERYHQRSIDYYKASGDSLGMSYGYENLGILKRKQSKYLDAIEFYNKALRIRLAFKDSSAIAFTYNDIGAAYMYLNKAKEAEKYLKKSIGIRERQNELIELAYTYNYLGENYEKSGNYIQAEISSKQALKVAQSIKNDKQIIEAYLILSDFFSRVSKVDSAFVYLKMHLAYKDSIERITNNELAEELTIKYETAEKEKLIQEQKYTITKNRYIIISIVFAIVVFATITWLGQSRRALRIRGEQQQQLTKAIVDAEESERKRIAADLHDGVGQLFSAVKMNLQALFERIELPKKDDQFLAEKTMALVDESCKEVRVISHKMMPNFLLKSGIASDIRSFIEKIDEHTLKIKLETKGFKEQLEFNEEVILYRVIQELINNVIKHANANELYLLLERSESYINVVLSDNGNGFNYKEVINKGGLGLKNIAVRINYLKGQITFSANQPKGTKVHIQIPVA